MEIQLRLDGSDLEKALEHIAAKASDMTPVMRTCAGIMAMGVEEAFAAESDPTTGTAWAPLAASTRRARAEAGHEGKTLQLSGSLAASIATRHTRNTAVVGTNKAYAAIHQFGGRTRAHEIRPRFKKALRIPGVGVRAKVQHPGSVIPARPFLGISKTTEDDIVDALEHYFNE